MGLLKKLIKGTGKPSIAKKEESLPAVIKRKLGLVPAAKAYPSRASRVQLHPLHSIDFTGDDPAFGQAVPLANISSTGMGFLRGTGNQWPAAGTVVRGTLRLADVRQAVSIRIVHSSPVIVGAQFVDPPPQLETQILTYFRLELTAHKMIEVSAHALKEVPDGTPHWYYGDNNCEVFFVTQGTRIVRFHLTFFANYVEGGEGIPAQFGQLEDGERDARTLLKSSSTVQFDPQVAEALTRAALSFLQNVPLLSRDYRSQIAALLMNKRGP